VRIPLTIVPETSGSENHSHSRLEDKNLQKLKSLKLGKHLTPCLKLLERQGLVGDVAIFLLSQLDETWLSLGSDELTKTENQGGQR
jgi:hypothetical protein